MTVSSEFKSREMHLTLLHVVVDSFVEVLAHSGFEDDWEMVSKPFSLTTSLHISIVKNFGLLTSSLRIIESR